MKDFVGLAHGSLRCKINTYVRQTKMPVQRNGSGGRPACPACPACRQAGTAAGTAAGRGIQNRER